MTIIPPRYGGRVTTDAMADTEAASSIPPWPIDFVPTPSAVEPDLIDGAGAVVVPVLVLAVVIFVALVAALV